MEQVRPRLVPSGSTWGEGGAAFGAAVNRRVFSRAVA